jgi:hypothetical protein
MSDYVPRGDLALIPPWAEKCNRIDTVKSKYLLGRRKDTTKDGSPRLTWLLDNGSTCHIADELEVLPYCPKDLLRQVSERSDRCQTSQKWPPWGLESAWEGPRKHRGAGGWGRGLDIMWLPMHNGHLACVLAAPRPLPSPANRAPISTVQSCSRAVARRRSAHALAATP